MSYFARVRFVGGPNRRSIVADMVHSSTVQDMKAYIGRIVQLPADKIEIGHEGTRLADHITLHDILIAINLMGAQVRLSYSADGNAEDMDIRGVCVACTTRQSEMAFPCNHLCICPTCYLNLLKLECPICREPGGATRMYFS